MGCAEWFWVFFGGTLMPDCAGHALAAAVLGEAAPPLITHAATSRDTPFMVCNRFQEGSSGRQVSWVDGSYGMFSESFHTKPRAFGQTYPFGVRWIAPDAPGHTMLWFSVPKLDEAIKGKFPGSHPHGYDVDAQTTLQHDGALLYGVNTEGEKKARYPYGLAFVPGGELAVIDEAATSGRVFLHYTGVLIAISATKTFPWDRKAPIRYASGTPKSGDSEFRIPGPTFAAAIETAREDEFSDTSPMERLEAFRTSIISKTKLKLITEAGLTGIYQDRRGSVIQRAFGGAGSIDGKPVDLDHWPLADSPWVRQPDRSQPLIVTDGKTQRIYDFKRWTITDSKCKP
jgi:hypothetical protein